MQLEKVKSNSLYLLVMKTAQVDTKAVHYVCSDNFRILNSFTSTTTTTNGKQVELVKMYLVFSITSCICLP